MSREEVLAYTAGLLDGEGCIGINKRGDNSGYRLTVFIANTDGRMIDFLINNFNFTSYTKQSGHNNKKWRICWRWCLSGVGAKLFLIDLLPYLIIKKEQAIYAIEFQTLIEKNGGKCLTKDHLNKRKFYYFKLRNLKTLNIKPSLI